MNVLFATDGSDGANDACELLTRFCWRDEDRVTVVSVVPHYIFLTGRIDTGYDGWRQELMDEESMAAEEIAEKASQRLKSFFARVETRLHAGIPPREILAAAGDIEADLIVMGGQGKTALKEFILGSVSRSVLDQAACSVLIGRGGADSHLGIVLGYDGSPSSEAALQWVQRLPLPKSAHVHVVSVAEPLPPPAASPLFAMPVEYYSVVSSLQERQQRKAEEEADRATGELQKAGLTVSEHVKAGVAAQEIMKVADECGADLVVVGTHTRQGWIQDVLSNTTRGLLHHPGHSVLVARPGVAQKMKRWDAPEEEQPTNSTPSITGSRQAPSTGHLEGVDEDV